MSGAVSAVTCTASAMLPTFIVAFIVNVLPDSTSTFGVSCREKPLIS